jgi:hypothetical protein
MAIVLVDWHRQWPQIGGGGELPLVMVMIIMTNETNYNNNEKSIISRFRGIKKKIAEKK